MPTHSKTARRSVAEVDARGRVSLARYGFKDTQVVVDEIEDGGLVLYPAVVLTPAELRHLRDPKAIAALEAALSSADRGDLQRLTLKTDSTD